jgi:hypothetical protein
LKRVMQEAMRAYAETQRADANIAHGNVQEKGR